MSPAANNKLRLITKIFSRGSRIPIAGYALAALDGLRCRSKHAKTRPDSADLIAAPPPIPVLFCTVPMITSAIYRKNGGPLMWPKDGS